jgi:pSer/pThr/pTyr-binding forkhead associated (FHA) protein/Tfp pilus assembly protein PilF
MKILLEILENNTPVLNKTLSEGVYRIGRSKLSDILLDNESVSRSHLEIRVTESSAYLTNMTASGKVKLNSEFVETAELKEGDELFIGPYQILIKFNQEEAPAPEPMASEEEPPNNVIQMPSRELVVEQPQSSFDGNAALKLEELPQQSFSQKGETVVEVKPVVAKLIFTEGTKKGQELFLEAYEVTLGRSKKADIFMDDHKLSRIHAKITRVGMGYRLVDMNSRNGTFVNGMRVLEHPLSSFDEIQLGHSKIQFIIHDLVSADAEKAPLPKVLESTKSVQMDPSFKLALEQVRKSEEFYEKITAFNAYKKLDNKNRNRFLIGAIIALVVIFFLLPESPKEKPKEAQTQQQTVLPTNMPKEYAELSPEAQRTIEGHYNAAVAAGDKGDLEQAVLHLKKIHEILPFYKKSRDYYDQYAKQLKEKEVLAAQERAKREEQEDLEIYLDEGKDYLKDSDFERAAEAFTTAINMDPNNAIAIKGLKAAQLKLNDISLVPPDKDPEQEKRKQVAELFQKAVAAFSSKAYQEAIDYAEEVRQIELKGDTQYLNEAKQIIDRAKLLQKEEFEPFLIQAKEKFAEGDYNSSRDLCEEMTKRDPAYEDAQECLIRAKKQLNKLAKEAYTHGYVLESMNKIEEAKQFWNRAKSYVRKGDEYYDKVMKKLEYYP